MSGRLYSFLPQALLYFVVSMGACGGLTYTMFHNWRNVSIVEDAFEDANEQLPGNTQPMDTLFMGPVSSFLKDAYQPIAESIKVKYEAARDAGTETLSN